MAIKKHLSKLLWLIPFSLSACQQPVATQEHSSINQNDITQLAEQVRVKYSVLDNRSGEHCPKDKGEGFCFKGRINLTVDTDIPARGWELYFSHLTPIRRVENDEFSITHINGDLHRITPTEKFRGFKAQQSTQITFFADYWHLSETDPQPNYYFTAPSLQPVIVKSTQTQIDTETGLETRPYVTEFTDRETQFKRQANDQTPWATAEHIFEANKNVKKLSPPIATAIIPTPKKLSVDTENKKINLAKGLKVNLIDVPRWAINAAMARLESFGIDESAEGIPLNIEIMATPKTDNINNQHTNNHASNHTNALGSYTLDIEQTQINIQAYDNEGAANGLNSLASLITLGNTDLPLIRVEDSPRYTFRGMHIDVARSFRNKAFILKLLDQMAAYKLNKLHLHLGDDEAWRVEIPDLPELTDIASKRCHNLNENSCLLPQLGSGPFSAPSKNNSANGYYSIKEYQDILRTASARHIQVIPSFDMPGHSRAAIKAMEARYRKWMAQGNKEKAEQYLLSDPKDLSVYASVQHYSDNTINPCMDSSYAFVEKIIDEMSNIHRQAGQPLTRYHIGADETAGAWTASPICKTFIENNKQIEDSKQLGPYFIERVAQLLTQKKIETAAWSDGLSHTKQQNMPNTVQSNAWTPLFWNGHQSAHEQANRGWQVIISLPDATYFDFPYEADPKERGYYWASRHTNTRKTFELMPDNLPAHAEFWQDRNAQNMEIDDRLQKNNRGEIVAKPLSKNYRFAGLQGHLWSETIRSDQQAEYMIFPRLIALAERAWHQADWEVPYNYEGALYNTSSQTFSTEKRKQREHDWQRFANAIGQKELPKLDLAEVFYRLPTVGAKIVNNALWANTIFPGLGIEYRVGSGEWRPYNSAVAINSAATVDRDVEIRAVSPNGQRKGRSLFLQP